MTKREIEKIKYSAQDILNHLSLFQFKQAQMEAQELKDYVETQQFFKKNHKRKKAKK